MDINKLLASSGRRRILKTLSKNQTVAIMKLVQDANSTYNEVQRNLGILESENLIIQEYSGRKRLLRLNYQNQNTLLLLKILRILDSPIDLNQSDDDFKFVIEQLH